jgi:hypothetical protein
VQPQSAVTVQIPQEWSEFIGLLRHYNTRFLVIGAHALAAYGRPRYTGDLDIFVDPDATNLEHAWFALRDFVGADKGVLEALLGGKIVQVGHPPMRLDVISKIDGVTFEEAWAGCMPVRLNEHSVNMIGRTEYIKNKKAAGRKKDLLDLALLEEVATPADGTSRNLREYNTAKTMLISLRKRRPKKPRPKKPRRPKKN